MSHMGVTILERRTSAGPNPPAEPAETRL